MPLVFFYIPENIRKPFGGWGGGGVGGWEGVERETSGMKCVNRNLFQNIYFPIKSQILILIFLLKCEVTGNLSENSMPILKAVTPILNF